MIFKMLITQYLCLSAQSNTRLLFSPSFSNKSLNTLLSHT